MWYSREAADQGVDDKSSWLGLVKQVSDTLHTWRDRVRRRRELAQWTDRDLHDVGLSWSDIALEVTKPFWRA
ncbi:DUF1127 domain-containing protein [Bradyrhizobium erythrophlei]|jgi:uncharacterized protein YjiS (DUF1127 family)|uniref:YjiS-like domain-containing protein n=1 Tax=Bradyrhizobium erythrophlei TaxID=1437360 RepID=A0A1H5CRH0_9BRAD|nr:protein of unknown function [Bradyrhizobium erythrophlei]